MLNYVTVNSRFLLCSSNSFLTRLSSLPDNLVCNFLKRAHIALKLRVAIGINFLKRVHNAVKLTVAHGRARKENRFIGK